jgi:hypothetical protein
MAKKKPEIVKTIQDYKPPFIDFSKQKVISHTQMTIFEGCQHRWGLHYRDKKKIPNSSIHLIFGTAMHEVMQKYITVFYEETKAAADRLDIEGELKTLLRQEYIKEYEKNGKIHFSDPAELDEFYIDGLEILRYFRSKFKGYFSKRGWWLIGCEIPINHEPIPNILYKGSLDVVLYHEPTNTIEILDIKTSTKGWGKWDKKNQIKLSQIILYKKFLSENFDFPVDNIKAKYFIVKRKLPEDSDYYPKRIQEYVPASGKIKQKKSYEILDNFVSNAFDKTGNFSTNKFKKNVSKYSCGYCPYNDHEDLCDKNKPNTKWRDPFTIS